MEGRHVRECKETSGKHPVQCHEDEDSWQFIEAKEAPKTHWMQCDVVGTSTSCVGRVISALFPSSDTDTKRADVASKLMAHLKGVDVDGASNRVVGCEQVNGGMYG